MNGSSEVVLERGTPRNAAVSSNLLEFYSHDPSKVFAATLRIKRASSDQNGTRRFIVSFTIRVLPNWICIDLLRWNICFAFG